MRYVIVRDDDTNYYTQPEHLETLYRPFLAKGQPVNLAVIPEVSNSSQNSEGKREGFLRGIRENGWEKFSSNTGLVEFIRSNPLLEVAQHGYDHSYFEFDSADYANIKARIEKGQRELQAAGIDKVSTFVAPYDKISKTAYSALAERFKIISTGWFEFGRVPKTWLPNYFLKKVFGKKHWKVGQTQLLSHPGCLLSRNKDYAEILNEVKSVLDSSDLTVLVTHWWEYFPDEKPDTNLIKVLHSVSDYLALSGDFKIIRFSDLLK